MHFILLKASRFFDPADHVFDPKSRNSYIRSRTLGWLSTNLKHWEHHNSFLKYHHKKPGFSLLLNIFVTFATAGDRQRIHSGFVMVQTRNICIDLGVRYKAPWNQQFQLTSVASTEQLEPFTTASRLAGFARMFTSSEGHAWDPGCEQTQSLSQGTCASPAIIRCDTVCTPGSRAVGHACNSTRSRTKLPKIIYLNTSYLCFHLKETYFFMP